VLVEARAEGVPPATASCYSSGLRVRVTPRAGLLQALRPSDAGESHVPVAQRCASGDEPGLHDALLAASSGKAVIMSIAVAHVNR
jgi:hypothetical protein